jgi:hypothetical protein
MNTGSSTAPPNTSGSVPTNQMAMGTHVLIDLNDVAIPSPRWDLEDIKRRLAETAREWLPELFPNARKSSDGKTLRCADLSGRRPRDEGSCVIHLVGRFAGWGFDHATGESAGPIDMIYHGTGLTDVRLFAEAARRARMDRPPPPPRPVEQRPNHGREIARILEGCQPLPGTVVETYLRARGVEPPDTPDLLFHPDLTDFETRRGWSGMVAIARDGAGEPTGGIHRTYLLDDGSAKAPPGKKMLGPIAGGAVRLAPFPEDGHVGVAEGIETALSAHAIFGVPTMAALSADGLRRWQWPAGTTRVTIFADAGHAGMQAAATLADRLNVADIPSHIQTPLHGDDFNDDLRHGVSAEEYEAARPEPASHDPAADPSPTTPEELLAAASALTNPTFTGTPAAPTAAGATSTTQLATTAFVQQEIAPKAPLASPTLTGTPAAPTAAAGTNTTQLATTAFVRAQIPAEFTGANQSFAATGYQKLPGGLILQWTNITIGSGGSTWTFPTAFPTACYFVGGNPAGASVAFADTLWVGTLSASQVALDFLNTNINNAYVFALGR